MGLVAPLKMGMASLTLLLLLLQFHGICISGFEVQSKVCGPDLLAYSNFLGRESFYINGVVVNKNAFCKAVEFYRAKDCRFDGHHCGLNLDPFLGNSPLAQGRKLLRGESSIHNLGGEIPQQEKKTEGQTLLNPQNTGIIATGLVVMCCSLLCPCIYKKKKTSAHSVLSKDQHSTYSVSSTEPIAIPEKVTASPARAPPSPFRVPPSPRISSPKLTRLGSLHLSMSQVARATHNFSQSLQIGEGGFGTVYKAQLEDGKVVAIKRAKKEHFEHLRTEFKSEVELLSKIDHRNLVKLLGYIEKGNDRIIITEYVPNGTLREHLDGLRGKILDFNQRLEISIDVSHALTYLHLYSERQIIHRDVKSSNILLTESMRAKVADFGFARLGSLDSERTHVSTKVKGTVGYLDPEYMKTNQLTPKSDVYSFGILLLEILTGRRPLEPKRPSHERVTLRWAFNKYEEGSVAEMVDPLMEEVVDIDIVMKMFALAIQCAAPIRLDRPDMKVVGEQLWAIRADYLKKSKDRVVINQ